MIMTCYKIGKPYLATFMQKQIKVQWDFQIRFNVNDDRKQTLVTSLIISLFYLTDNQMGKKPTVTLYNLKELS